MRAEPTTTQVVICQANTQTLVVLFRQRPDGYGQHLAHGAAYSSHQPLFPQQQVSKPAFEDTISEERRHLLHLSFLCRVTSVRQMRWIHPLSAVRASHLACSSTALRSLTCPSALGGAAGGVWGPSGYWSRASSSIHICETARGPRSML